MDLKRSVDLPVTKIQDGYPPMNMPHIALHGLPKRLVDDQLIAATVLEEATVSAKTS